jgi:hypothetical protein
MPRPASTTARGYGTQHQTLRKEWAPLVEQGGVTCWRCGNLIAPGQAWDLGHDDHDRATYRGPEHRGPNRAAGARKGNRSPLRRRGARPAPGIRQPPTAARW